MKQLLALIIIHNIRLFLQDSLSWELIKSVCRDFELLPLPIYNFFSRGYALKFLELLLAIVFIAGFETFQQSFSSLRDATLSIITLITIVGAVAMFFAATMDFFNVLLLTPELAIVLVVYQWLTTPLDDTRNAILSVKRLLWYRSTKPTVCDSSQLQCFEVVHVAIFIVRLIKPVMTELAYMGIDYLQTLAM